MFDIVVGGSSLVLLLLVVYRFISLVGRVGVGGVGDVVVMGHVCGVCVVPE